ncbi:unnamed protein product, partial [Iphiclides podalirius]
MKTLTNAVCGERQPTYCAPPPPQKRDKKLGKGPKSIAKLFYQHKEGLAPWQARSPKGMVKTLHGIAAALRGFLPPATIHMR